MENNHCIGDMEHGTTKNMEDAHVQSQNDLIHVFLVFIVVVVGCVNLS